jgi:hypothetical protein
LNALLDEMGLSHGLKQEVDKLDNFWFGLWCLMPL